MRKKKWIIVISIITLLVFAVFGVRALYLSKIAPFIDFKRACSAFEEGDYATYLEIFDDREQFDYRYEGVAEKENISRYYLGLELMEEKMWFDALIQLGMSSYLDAEEQYRIACYHYAEEMMIEGEYRSAVEKFTEAGNYNDASEKLLQARYELGCEYLENQKYTEAYEEFSTIRGYSDVESIIREVQIEMLRNAEEGDVVFWGSYEQDNNFVNGPEPIEWIVLNKSVNSFDLLSKYCLDYQPYHTRQESVTWAECTLRSWLNNTFFNTAFSDAEQTVICSETYRNSDNHNFGTKGGSQTTEKVTLFSSGVPEYYHSYKGIIAKPTEYVRAISGDSRGYDNEYYGFSYWIRRPGMEQDAAAYIMGGDYSPFEVAQNGTWVSNSLGVRPLIDIDISLYRGE